MTVKDIQHLNIASAVAAMSKCKRAKVGATIVDPKGRIVSTGYNGCPKGSSNTCEDENNKTKAEVIHAEQNAIAFAWRDLAGCTLYVTLSPCQHCAPLIVQHGIKRVVYREQYRCTKAITYLEKHGVEVDCLAPTDRFGIL